ncbi:hypothetical protein [Capnocytophaga felis]|uniref:Uncharacterized protein n=1 Tax=Capnocytophaga felis TaxID=2267611 RepID=A0A5M4B8X0_9FLAO|nr:hypothetical protein [Capnocytophaga felis]GET45647.1 hypothetical protein RCZ01_09490 [Capnocytophaga felis]GET47190.1 hypothetical protein RCZ02_00210 [Capnocytophaga felis]
MKNLEKQFQDKLSNHSIEPSTDAWERLEALLPKNEKTITKQRNLKWIWAAASTVIILAISGLLLFKNSSEIIENEEIVNLPAEKVKKEIISEKEIFTKPTEKESVTSIRKEKINQKEVIKLPEIEEKEISVISSEEKIEEIENQTDILKILEKETKTTKNKYISARELLALVENTDIEKITLEKEIQSPNPNRIKLEVDAQLLLSQIEKETNNIHRTNLLKTILEKYEDFKERIAYEQSK